MPGRIETIKPRIDLGEYLCKIKEEYAAMGLGISLAEPNELGMLIEKDLLQAGLVDEKTYKAEKKDGSLVPVITRSKDYKANLNYKILKIKPAKKAADEYLKDNAKGLLEVLFKAGAEAYRGAAYKKEEFLYLVLGAADEDGNIFEDDMIKRLEDAV